jgi:hypothetical protein
MALINCPECDSKISDKAITCPKCGYPIKPISQFNFNLWRGYEWKSKSEFFGLPLIHVAIGRDKNTGKLLVAKGIIAIGQFGIGLITIAQFGIGLLFGLGQFVGGIFAIGQFALGVWFGLGQFASGAIAIGQMAVGYYVRAQIGYGKYMWTSYFRDSQAIEFFRNLWKY